MKNISVFGLCFVLATACGGRMDKDGLIGEIGNTSAQDSDGATTKAVVDVTIEAEEGADPATECVPGRQPHCTIHYSDGSVTYGYIVCQSDRRWGTCTQFTLDGTSGAFSETPSASIASTGGVTEVTSCPNGEKYCHDCAVTSEMDVPWGENYAIAGNEQMLIFLQNDGGEGNPAVQRMFRQDGSSVGSPVELATSSWTTSIFSSPSGFVITAEDHGDGPGTFTKLNMNGTVLRSLSMRYVIGNGGLDGFDILEIPYLQLGSFISNSIQLVDVNGNFGKTVGINLLSIENGVSYPYINTPATAGNTVALPNGIVYFSGPKKDTVSSRFDISNIDTGSTVSAPIVADVSLNGSWSDGSDYFVWYTHRGGGEGVYRIGQDGTVKGDYLLDENPINVVKRPSGFVSLTSVNLSLYRYTTDGKILSANMLRPGFVQDGSAGIRMATSDDKHFLVATPDKANDLTRLHFVTCD